MVYRARYHHLACARSRRRLCAPPLVEETEHGMRARDVIVLVALAWWMLRDREETQVGLTETCIGPGGDRLRVPLGDCPPGYTLETSYSYPTEPCDCDDEPCSCSE